MRAVETLAALRAARSASGADSVGLVPTMGALHEGHLSLIRRSVEDNQLTIVSIFVNPAQFDDPQDLAAYPHQLEADRALARRAGCGVLYLPDANEMYPEGFDTWVEVGGLAQRLEGSARPGHFRGVATVVLKLLLQTAAHRVYFGEKDFQQLAVIERMVRDLDVPIEVVRCPTVREVDGLAMSSRNRQLDQDARQAASRLYEGLSKARESFLAGEERPSVLRKVVEEHLEQDPRLELEYASAADPLTLHELDSEAGTRGIVLSLAARVGGVRLIDNVGLARRALKGTHSA